MTRPYDAIIVGARCGGAPTAMLLARKGYRVLLADRASFPSDLPHGHFVHRHGPPRLARWGLLDRVAATGAPAVDSITLEMGDFPLVGTSLVVDGVPMGYGPRRSALDAVLVGAAVEAGAELRERFTVEAPTFDGDRVTGIRGRSASGVAVDERAAIIVGADGRRSRIARAVGAPTEVDLPTVTCWYFSYWGDAPTAGLEVYVRGDHVVFAFPTNDGLLAVFVGWRRERLDDVRGDVEGSLMAAIDGVPALAERVRTGRRAERLMGATDLPNFIRKPWGPGWALVGDAGCHKDPYLALGVCDALRDAELLADAIDEGLSGRARMDDALACYERRRAEATRGEFDYNFRLAHFEPPPAEALALRAALRERPEDTTRFYLATQGLAPRESFFNPENLGRILGGAPGRG
jgi:flavin-dependent dehydrogenase